MNNSLFSQRVERFGAWTTIFLCFSVACLGTAATTISSFVVIVFWLLSFNFLHYRESIKTHPFTLIALLLFLYLAVSLLWSEHVSEGLTILKKYREFILFPVFISYLGHESNKRYGLIALYGGMLVAVVMTYLVYFELITSPPRQHSLGNRIFNGILISFFAYWSLSLAVEYKKHKVLFIALYLLACGCILVLRNGQTGQVLLILLSLLFVYQYWHWKGISIVLLLTVPPLIFVLFSSQTILNIIASSSLFDLEGLAKLDIRMEYYINTLRIMFNHWLLGVGAGDFPAAYLEVSRAHENFWGITANPHNEFFMIASQTGVVGLTLFLYFFVALWRQTLTLPTLRANFAVATVLTITIACLFNSSFLDTNDGTLFMLLISLFFSQATSSSLSTNINKEKVC